MDKYYRNRYADDSPRWSDSDHVYHRQDVPLRSDQALRIHKKLVDSFLNGQKLFDYWRLSRVESLENENFEMEYSQIRNDFLAKGFRPEEVSSNLGFLATTADKMVKISLKDGLCVRSSPINTLGYCIAGVHLSTHADVCLQEAALELGGDVKDVILVAFKFMYGRRNPVVPSVGGTAPFWSPTPGYNSHVSSTSPQNNDGLPQQHVRSLVYLYEFENQLFHPRRRPRHCCPSAALHFRLIKPLHTPGLLPLSQATVLPLLAQPTSQASILPPALKSAVDLVTSDPAVLRMVEGPARSGYPPALMDARDLTSLMGGGFRTVDQVDSGRKALMSDRRSFLHFESEEEHKPDIHSRLGPKRHPYLKGVQPWREDGGGNREESDGLDSVMTGGFRLPTPEPPKCMPLMSDQSILGSYRRQANDSQDRRQSYDNSEPAQKRVLLGGGLSARSSHQNPYAQRSGNNSADQQYNNRHKRPLLEGPSDESGQQQFSGRRDRSRGPYQRGRGTPRKTLL